MKQNWVKKGKVFNVDGQYDWNKTHAQVPIVDIIDNNTFRIYYSTRDELGKSRTSFLETSSDDPKKILYKHNKPILDLGQKGTFDDSGIMPTSILTIGKKKYLYYIGWTTRKTVPYSNSVGLAISEDNGFSFKRYSEGPIIGVGDKEPYFTGTCFVLKIEDKYIAYYLSCKGWKDVNGSLEPLYDLKIAISENAINWDLTGKVAIPLHENEGGIASASVIKIKSKFYMWYSIRGISDFRQNKDNSYRIGYAKSNDGIVWERKENTILPLSESGWDSTMLAYPNIIQFNQKLLMFYNGNGFGKSGFGYAELKSN